MRSAGIILIVIGVLMMIYTGFNYVTEKRVVDLGPLKVNKSENHPVRWSPIVGGILLIGGLALMLTNKKKIS
jgi:LPXTG-motif cell wall-anchored protein